MNAQQLAVLAILLLAGYVPVALAAYAFGWQWRGKFERERFDDAFRHFDKGFDTMRDIFR